MRWYIRASYKKRRAEAGYFLAEVVVATFLVGVLVACLWPIWQEMQRLHEKQQADSEALHLLQNTVEMYRSPCQVKTQHQRTVTSQRFRAQRYQITHQCNPLPGLSAWSVQVRWTNSEGKVEQKRFEGQMFNPSTEKKQDSPMLK